MKIFLDVGAERGYDSIPLAKENPDVLFYAFEPNPYMVEHLKNETKDLSNYIIIQKAVSDYNGVSNFNICKYGPVGISSLLEFSSRANVNWAGFYVNADEKIDVEVITLKSFIEEYNIKNIDFFHCDTQGSDLRVLKGMEDYIKLIQFGQVEAAIRPESLYVNQNTYQETMSFLVSKGFEILEMKSEGGMRECNIIFKKAPLTFAI